MRVGFRSRIKILPDVKLNITHGTHFIPHDKQRQPMDLQSREKRKGDLLKRVAVEIVKFLAGVFALYVAGVLALSLVYG
jgi:hypothetical protein